jgi:hypothetical protein
VQLVQGRNVLIDAECDAERPIFEEFEQCILPFRKPCEQMHRFGHHRFADEKRRLQLLDLFNNPAVILFCPIEESD